MPRRNTPRRTATARGARIATDRYGIVTVVLIRRAGRVLVTRDRHGRTWELHRAGSRWTVVVPRSIRGV